jgi:hypothetical protein
MRFNFGPIPENEDFHPEEEGWSGIREPSPLQVNLAAIPIGLLLFGMTFLLASSAWIGGLPAAWRGSAMLSNSSSVLVILGILILSIPVHELVHALVHPDLGRSRESILGLWLSRGIFYAHYEGEMSRNRFLAILAAPFLALAILPILALSLLGPNVPVDYPRYLAMMALMNSVLAAGDALGFILIISQIPASARVRNQGWKSYWIR